MDQVLQINYINQGLLLLNQALSLLNQALSLLNHKVLLLFIFQDSSAARPYGPCAPKVATAGRGVSSARRGCGRRRLSWHLRLGNDVRVRLSLGLRVTETRAGNLEGIQARLRACDLTKQALLRLDETHAAAT
jgi:hypothetical protein